MCYVQMTRRSVVAAVFLAGLNLGCNAIHHYYTFSRAQLAEAAENRGRTEFKASWGMGVKDENFKMLVYGRNYVYVGSNQQQGSSPVPDMLRILIGLHTLQSPLSFDPFKVQYLAPEQGPVEPAFVRGPEEPCRWASRYRYMYQVFREIGREYSGGAAEVERTACFEIFFEVAAAPEQEFDLILGGLTRAGEPISPVRLHFFDGGKEGTVYGPADVLPIPHVSEGLGGSPPGF